MLLLLFLFKAILLRFISRIVTEKLSFCLTDLSEKFIFFLNAMTFGYLDQQQQYNNNDNKNVKHVKMVLQRTG